jgi:hypothetical protein
MPNLLGHNILTLYRYCTTKLCNFTNSVVPSSAVMFVGLNKLSLYTNNNCYKLRNNNTDLYRTIDLSHFFHLVRNQGYRIFIANCQKSNTFSTICFLNLLRFCGMTSVTDASKLCQIIKRDTYTMHKSKTVS